MNRKILIVIAVVIIAAVAYLMYPQSEKLDFRTGPTTMIFGWSTPEKKVLIHVKNVGGETSSIYLVQCLGEGNYTFYKDIVIPPQVECTIEFPMLGGPVTLNTLSGSPPAEGGQIASPNWSGNMTSGSYITVMLYTRADQIYTLDHVEKR